MKLKGAKLFLAATMLLIGTVAFSQGGPPMITDDTGTVEKGHFEINTAFTIESGAEGRLWGVPLIDFNFGTSRNTQLKIEIPYYLLRNNVQPQVRGLGNTNIGVRWRFRDGDDKGRLAVSMYPQIEFNTPGSSVRSLGIVEQGPELLMPLQGEMHWGKTGVNGHVGYRLKRNDDELIYGYNPIAVLYCCKYGIALFDEPEQYQAYSPNVAYELGMMHYQNKECLILRHGSLPVIRFDLIKDLYSTYDRDLQVRGMIASWIKQVAIQPTTN